MNTAYPQPGVYREDWYVRPTPALPTGVPALIGLISLEEAQNANLRVEPLGDGVWRVLPDSDALPIDPYQQTTLLASFANSFPKLRGVGNLAYAVEGFFRNGGVRCYPLAMAFTTSPTDALRVALTALASYDALDLVCAPDIVRFPADVGTMQSMLLEHCTTIGDRFALLDAPDPTHVPAMLPDTAAGAMYFPWIDIGLRDTNNKPLYLPPCGHVAGIYARSDARSGVHKAPANELLDGVFDLSTTIEAPELRINALRSLPGRGIRVYGARTLSSDQAWTYINVRRLFLTIGRWLRWALADLAFEPNDPLLQARVERELTAYCAELLQNGALRGTAQEAFFVQCDQHNNPPDVRDHGQLIADIGLAPSLPNEFIVVRLLHSEHGLTITTPALASI
jgi:hypothetical protein